MKRLGIGLVLLLVLASWAYVERKEPVNADRESRKTTIQNTEETVSGGRFLDLEKFHLPPEVSAYARQKYSDGLIPFPLEERDKMLLEGFLDHSEYIIKFRDTPLLSCEKEIKASHAKTLKEMKEYHGEDSDIKIEREFSRIFNGISIENASDEDIQGISNLDAVEKIYLKKEYHILLTESPDLIGATDVWELNDSRNMSITGRNVTIAIIDTGVDYTHQDLGNCTLSGIEGDIFDYALESDHPYDNDMNYTWIIQQEGFTRITVHFTEIDVESYYDHLYIKNASDDVVKDYSGYFEDEWSPSVAGDTIKINLVTDYIVTKEGFWIDQVINGTSEGTLTNCSKVIGGYDFVSEDGNPMDDHGHGTHCAGIAAGNGTLKGIAPDAKVLSYKVLDSSGGGEEDDIIAAIEKAITDGADIISLSLGGTGDPDDALSLAVDNAVNAGVVVVVAAGNSGPNNETVGSPGCARKALTVGALYKDNDSSRNRLSSLSVASEANKEIESLALTHSALTPAGGLLAGLAYAGLGFPEDFEEDDYTGKIALIGRGNISFYSKVRNAYDAGASGAVIYNNYYGNFKGDLVNLSDIPAVSVSEEDGEYLFSLMGNGSVTLNMSVDLDPAIMADFSSRGPAYIYNKPDVLAPGVNICSAKLGTAYAESPCLDDAHVSFSGTSMATPHVAGAAALLLQKNPGWTPLEVKASLEETAQDKGYDPNTQGAGEIDILSAAQLESPPPIAFISDIEDVTYATAK